MAETPRVSIGVPVYNGEAFLREALDSALAQNFRDFEVIISDNASTDGTAEICRAYLDQDNRIRYVRNEENLGASPNWRRVYELSRGKYFCWLPADDAMQPEFLARAVALLDERPDVVLVFSQHYVRVGSGAPEIHEGSQNADLSQPTAYERVRKLIRARIIGPDWPIFGLYRSKVLGETHLLRPMIGGDDMLVMEMVLKGKVAQISEPLYILRTHPDAWHQARMRQAKGLAKLLRIESIWAAEWFDTANKRKKVALPHWRRLWEFFLLMLRSDANWREKMSLFSLLPVYAAGRWKRMTKELIVGAVYGVVYAGTEVFRGVERARRRIAFALSDPR